MACLLASWICATFNFQPVWYATVSLSRPVTYPISFYRVAACIVAIIILCLPAIWNGFPLLFDDVGGYLERWPTRTLGLGRSTVYGLLLWVTASTWWIPVIILQAAVTIWVVDRALKVLGFGRRSPWSLLVVAGAIAATTRVAFFVSEVMPDAWAAPAVLALHLLSWHADRLNGFERAAMAAIIALAGACHMAILGLLAGLSILHAVAWLVYRWLRIAPANIIVAGLAAWSGIILLLAVNLVVAGRFALTPGGDVILFGRLVASGHVSKILAEDCPRNHWRLCAFRDEMEMDSENFLYDADSPLREIGGWDDPVTTKEIGSIIVHSALAHPFEHLTSAISLAAEQLVTIGASDSMDPLKSAHTRWMINLYAPWLFGAYDVARQQQVKFAYSHHNLFRRPGYRNLDRWSRWVVSPVSIASTFALPLTAVFLWRRDHRREAMLPAMLFLALVGNAFICGAISGPYDRYQARLVWLAPLAVGLTLGRRGSTLSRGADV
jgi:hypothetical protein